MRHFHSFTHSLSFLSMGSGTTTLTIALVVGLCGGMLVITALGLLCGYFLRRHWMAKRHESFERARIHASHPVMVSKSATGFRPYVRPEHPVLHNIPVSLSQHPPSLAPGNPYKHIHPTHLRPSAASHCSAPNLALSSTGTDNVRFPSIIPEHATQPATIAEGPGSPLRRTGTMSSKYKLGLSRPSMRNTSLRYSRLSHSMLSRLPSHFRSGRSSRCISLESGESLGMPENQIPMARRIQRKEQRFQYDSSSYSSSVATPEDGWNMPETDSIMPPPPAMLKSEQEHENDKLHERIKEWQEQSIVADAPESEDGHSHIAELPPSKWRTDKTRIARYGTPSSSYSSGSESLYSHTTLSDVINPYMRSNTPTSLMRIPSIRPHFMAETSLESWLGPSDPRVQVRRQRATPSPSPSSLFKEVPMGGLSAEAVAASGRTPSPWAPESNSVHSSHSHLVRGPVVQETPQRSSRALLPTTPPPTSAGMAEPTPSTEVQLYLHPVTTTQRQRISQAGSTSSRSSYPSSARLSVEFPQDWKHSSNGTMSTELTWVEEASPAAVSKDTEVDGFNPQQAHTPDQQQHHFHGTAQHDISAPALPVPLPRRDVSAATDVEAMGFAYDPTEPELAVYYPQTPQILRAMHTRHASNTSPESPVPCYPNTPRKSDVTQGAAPMLSSGSVRPNSPASTASSESVSTEHGSHHTRPFMSPSSLLASPMETIQAWFQVHGEKLGTRDTPLGPRAMV